MHQSNNKKTQPKFVINVSKKGKVERVSSIKRNKSAPDGANLPLSSVHPQHLNNRNVEVEIEPATPGSDFIMQSDGESPTATNIEVNNGKYNGVSDQTAQVDMTKRHLFENSEQDTEENDSVHDRFSPIPSAPLGMTRNVSRGGHAFSIKEEDEMSSSDTSKDFEKSETISPKKLADSTPLDSIFQTAKQESPEQSVSENFQDFQVEEETQGHYCFDGIMHLQSLLNFNQMERDVFSCRKDPFVQIISGLKDPNVVLTVNLKSVERRNRAKIQKEAEDGLLAGEHYGVVLRNHNTLRHTEQQREAELKALKDQLMRRKIQSKIEWNRNFDKIHRQYTKQNGAPREYTLELEDVSIVTLNAEFVKYSYSSTIIFQAEKDEIFHSV